MQNSKYTFKSPHWKKSTGKILNKLNEVAGDSRRLPGKTPRGKTMKEFRDTPENIAISEEIISMMENFSQLQDYSSLELLEKTLPLRYVFVLPARQGIVIYSAYSMLLSKKKGELANYSRVQEYLGIPIDDKNRSKKDNYHIYTLIQSYFRLYTLSKPFRYLLGLPVRVGWYSRKSSKMMKKNTKYILKEIERMDEWKKVSSPGKILKKTYKILNKHGFQVALQYIRYLFRGSGLIREIMIKKKKKIDPEKIKGLTKRYLDVKEAIKACN
jgi:hypothetical protein